MNKIGTFGGDEWLFDESLEGVPHPDFPHCEPVLARSLPRLRFLVPVVTAMKALAPITVSVSTDVIPRTMCRERVFVLLWLVPP